MRLFGKDITVAGGKSAENSANSTATQTAGNADKEGDLSPDEEPLVLAVQSNTEMEGVKSISRQNNRSTEF